MLNNADEKKNNNNKKKADHCEDVKLSSGHQ